MQVYHTSSVYNYGGIFHTFSRLALPFSSADGGWEWGRTTGENGKFDGFQVIN